MVISKILFVQLSVHLVETASFTIGAITDASVDENAVYTSVTPALSGEAPIGAFSYSLGGSDAGLFSIDAATGVVSMVARDFESAADAGANNIYEVSITVTDSDGNNATEAWAVTVADVVETASFSIDAITDATVNENGVYTGATPAITGAPFPCLSNSGQLPDDDDLSRGVLCR